ncbi:30S ribosomal protein S6 [Mycoplasmopsis columbinasalis]|uniref:Small ribosomal subunit protein bS6 n=1 Tax=Mycoplasmopsis columbinasalis TaxID=114880 RepID=A0A449B9F1_9BACT|nr:30S ribosomal protein S6 [Mycoplasmopsis columbinasalis]VEU77797.1 30S ribosomal protein S6 [Mycoplasmopsis columbinasalis]
MSKYEIILILDPKAEDKVGFNLVNDVFGQAQVSKAEKMQITDLAYPIHSSHKAQFLNFLVKSPSHLIAEFVRRANIVKEIWKHLVVNLDTEKGYGKERKVFKKHFVKRDGQQSGDRVPFERREYKKPRQFTKPENATPKSE